VDKAAKERIFSPEDPPKVIAEATQKLPPEHIADDPQIARRVLEMGAAETTERLGPHKYQAQVRFEWSGKHHKLELSETRTLVAGPHGVNGDFHATVDNSDDQGLEVLRVAGQVFAREKYGKFRERRRDRGMAERAREDAFGALRELADLFQDRFKLDPQGTTTYEGRTAWRYSLSLGPARPQPAAAHLPPVIQPKGGRDADTARRLRFFDKRDPKAVSGEIWVDADTSTVLKARIDGRLTAPGEGDIGELTLRVSLDAHLSDIGKDPALKPPKDFLPDVDKPLGIADALDRFGIPRAGKGADAGTETEQEDDSQ
jgi:hypothetical protein